MNSWKKYVLGSLVIILLIAAAGTMWTERIFYQTLMIVLAVGGASLLVWYGKDQYLFDLRNAIGTILLAVVAFLAMWKLPGWQAADLVSGSNAEVITQTRQAVAQAFVGYAVLVGLFLTGYQLVAVQQDFKISERLSKASQKLGSQMPVVERLCAAFELEHVAQRQKKRQEEIAKMLRTAFAGELEQHKTDNEMEKSPDDAKLLMAEVRRIVEGLASMTSH